MREFALAAPNGIELAASGAAGNRSAVWKSARPIGISEVGVTDSIMSTIWTHAPSSGARSITSPAETEITGADIPFVDVAGGRILLYQSKIGERDGPDYRLKSNVTTEQVDKLRSPSIQIDGVTYSVTGRLAVYQGADTQPCFGHDRAGARDRRRWLHWFWSGRDDVYTRKRLLVDCHVAHMRKFPGCSAGAVRAAPVGKAKTSEVLAFTTWPWEFDFLAWTIGVDSHVDKPRSPEPVAPLGQVEPLPDDTPQLSQEVAEAVGQSLGYGEDGRALHIVAVGTAADESQA